MKKIKEVVSVEVKVSIPGLTDQYERWDGVVFFIENKLVCIAESPDKRKKIRFEI